MKLGDHNVVKLDRYASQATDASIVQKEQANLANEKRLREMSNDRWSPTAGEMGRMEMDSQLAHNSGKIMSEIENLGFKGISGLERAKGDFTLNKDSTSYTALTSQDGINSGNTNITKTKTENQTMAEAVDKMGGLNSYIERTSDSESWKQFSSASKNIGAESGFEKLYEKYGSGRSREGFYDYMNTQTGRQEIANSLGNANVTSNKTDSELVNIGAGTTIGSNVNAESIKRTQGAVGEELMVDSNMQSNLKKYGDIQGFKEIAQHYGMSTEQLAKTFSEYDNAVKMADTNTMKSIAEKVTGKEGMAAWSEFQNMRSSANVVHADENGTHTVSYDKGLNNVNSTTDASQTYLKNNTMEEKTVLDTSNVTNRDNIYSKKDVHDTSHTNNTATSFNAGISYSGVSTMAINKEYLSALSDGDYGKANQILNQRAAIDGVSSLTSLSGLAKGFGDATQTIDIYAEKHHLYEKTQDGVSMFTDAYVKNAENFVTDHGPSGGSGQTPGSSNYIKPADRK